MKKRVPIAIAAALTACGAVATTSNDSAESAPQKSAKAKPQPRIGVERFDQGGMVGCFDPNLSGYARVAAERIGGVPCGQSPAGASGDDWPGEYSGDTDGGSGNVSIKSAGGGAYRVEVATVNSETGCGGSISGAGTVTGNRLSFSDTLSLEGYGKAVCTMRLTRQGNRLNVSGEGDCHLWSGKSCSLMGSMTRRGAASSKSAGSASAAGQPFVVGAWVERSVGCGGHADLVIEADGTYVDDSAAGDWSLSGNTLTFIPRETAELAEDPTPIPNPQPVRIGVASSGPRGMVMRESGGKIWTMVRCR